MENIAQFVAAVTELGVPASDRFDGIDLFEGVNMKAVVNCVMSLHKIALDRGLVKE
jgi:hypothetical protein